MMDLTSRVALVTGASRGIGRGHRAARWPRQGATVVAAARGDNAQAVADEIVADGLKAEALTLDVTDAGVGRRGDRRACSSGTAGSTSWSATPASRATSCC